MFKIHPYVWYIAMFNKTYSDRMGMRNDKISITFCSNYDEFELNSYAFWVLYRETHPDSWWYNKSLHDMVKDDKKQIIELEYVKPMVTLMEAKDFNDDYVKSLCIRAEKAHMISFTTNCLGGCFDDHYGLLTLYKRSWGDNLWAVHLHGNDDCSYGKEFTNKEDAIKYYDEIVELAKDMPFENTDIDAVFGMEFWN